jgi:Tol biopolymer transport system component
MALTYRRAYPTIAELSQPILRLAGARVNPNTNGPQRTANIYAITLRKIADGSETKVTVPAQANLSNIHFSPDGSHLSFLNTKTNGIELWIAETATGRSRMITGTDRLNATTGDPCDWLRDSKTLVCTMVASMRRPGAGGADGPDRPERPGKHGQGRAGSHL